VGKRPGAGRPLGSRAKRSGDGPTVTARIARRGNSMVLRIDIDLIEALAAAMLAVAVSSIAMDRGPEVAVDLLGQLMAKLLPLIPEKDDLHH
jgi:hypothetical protein